MTSLIDKINSPEDMKRLAPEDLSVLSDEVRDIILRTVSNTGGHLASSLGTVELSVVLHYVFDCPRDQIIWDVGHQAYTHKILTGRRDAFGTLRREGGISGFPKRDESPYDAYGTGHSSTSISAALGTIEAFKQLGKQGRVVAVIGDGGLTGGMAFEALNHAGHLDRNLIVVLNDNEMSIHPNVGALSSFLSRKMTTSTINRLLGAVKDAILSLPRIGEGAFHIAKRFKDALKNFLTPGYLFEGFGFTYVGPIDGHRIDQLLETFRNVKAIVNNPVLVHVRTVKGKGYEPAEREPVKFHGVGPFNRRTGEITVSDDTRPSYTSVFSDALIEVAEADRRVVAITAAMPNGTGVDKFMERFPDRCYDVGIAEQHAVGFAAGLAAQGLRPVVAVYSTFMQRAYDQVIHDVCLQNLPVTFMMDRAGLVGADGPTHHGSFDLSYLRHVPNMTVMAPSNEEELRRMLATALTIDGPCAIRYPRGKATGMEVSSPIEPLETGKAEMLRTGRDAVILAVGVTVNRALVAADKLSEEGVETGVVNVRFVKPMDEALISELAAKIGKVLVVEENMKAGGFGAAVMEMLSEKDISDVKVKLLGIPDSFVPHGASDSLLSSIDLDADGIRKGVLGLMGISEIRPKALRQT